ncbi:MAG: energy-coupled thiamine transporter ThiT [Firmicutes bacterium]|nr:energy-coupled thiamine transporter ThiT [Bacillota bacterium]
MSNSSYSKTRIMVECAIMIALGTVLAQIKVFEMPNGGSITLLSSVPFIMISLRHGTRWGVLAGFVNSLLQMALGGLWPTPAGTAFAMLLEILLDYVLAFTCLGLAAFFAGKPGNRNAFKIAFGTFFVCFLRFCCSFLSGVIVWGSIAEDGIGAVTYSLSYNASYMVPETLLTVAGIVALYNAAPRLFEK